MPGFKDFVNLAVLLETDMDDLVMKQAVMKFTGAAQRTSQLTGFFREGLISYLDDLNTIGVNTGATDVWNTIGPVHGALTPWTPTITQSGNVTFTNTYSRYIRVGRLVTGWFNLAVTGTGTASNAIIIGGLPFSTAVSGVTVGAGELTDVSAGLKFQFRGYLAGGTTFDLRSHVTQADNRMGIAGTQFALALASGDVIEGTISYETGADA